MASPDSNIAFDQSNVWMAFKKGDMQAFEMLYTQHVKFLGSYGMRLFSDKELVENAIQDVFVDLWQRRMFLGDVVNIKFYLLKALKNKYLHNFKRYDTEHYGQTNDYADKFHIESIESRLISAQSELEKKQNVKSALDQLTRRQSEIINLRFYQGLSLDEISELLQLNKQVVKNVLTKSYSILREHVHKFPLLLFFFWI